MTLTSALRAAGLEARGDDTTRAIYSSDASLYRVPPLAVAFPRSAEELATAYGVARDAGVPLTSRGAGTSVAGNAVGPGLVVDTSRHLNRILEIDPEARTARVQPGVVQEQLQRAAAPYGLRFGPDPSTSTRCTIGGMIGNNACGSRSLGYGRTVDNVLALRGFFGTTSEFAVRSGYDDATPTEEAAALRGLAQGDLAHIRTQFGRFGRQVSGYSLEHLLPERGADVTRFLVGSEGTLGVVTEATVRLVPDPKHRRMIALGFTDIVAAGVASPAVLVHQPTACEGLDARLIDVLRSRRGDAAVPELPRGGAWLFVEVSGDDLAEVDARAAAVAADPALGAVDSRVVMSAAETAALWRIRADGAGLAGRSPAGEPAWPGWEDAAVPPEQLGAYLRDFDELVTSHGLTSAPFGHFGDGCMHVRLDLPLQRPDARNVLRSFMTDAAVLVGRYGGSLSGEHGDGRARSELLPHMYDETSLALFGRAKRICDPENLLSPGVLVDPAPIDDDLRFPAPPAPRPRRSSSLALAWAADDGDFAQSVHRCTGVGKCRADNTGSGGVMCPSYQATKEEKDSTRGRARALQEMINGTVVQADWRAPEVHEALDLCLSCKGCLSDCPTGVDMASMKSEVLHQAYAGRRRPISHYTLGRLPQWLRLARRTPRIARMAMRFGDKVGPAKRLGGVDSRRSIPVIAPRSFAQWAAEHELHPYRAGAVENPALLWVDTFTDEFTPEIGEAMVAVLRAAGYQPVLPSRSTCCGLTLISTGQLDAAKSTLTTLVSTLAPAAADGVPIVGVEPSCTAVLRHDLLELLPDDERATTVAHATVTLAELLTRTDRWTPPNLTGTRVVAQPHCHHHAVMSWSADEALLKSAGAEVVRVGGCCGLAGNFGVEQGHYEVSVAVAETNLLPAVRAATPEDVILADGFSCRTQLRDLADKDALHLAQLLAGASTKRHPERRRE
ncbi:MAG TPA: FAD-binding and (Fe-S)-binding domain-containing protein [Flexivirga sp.]|uniref:FAD-binding and (Fe-S)-binding domain-containing protein n=1 Tax=Flexivirga sp. TaxID=1962927 RepID=UPI002BBD180E|nr:FAD-binding and (Fe-S)-binding domain-containing protein [Flexivirga sp.]HWC21112.1 FAD-binding and (Fe-S)-binding domain-containing protein [Flexivirga sp.]